MDKTKRRIPSWLLEGLFIVVSVVLGFAVSQFGEYRADNALRARVLTSVREEVEHNLAQLEPLVAIHGAWARALAADKPGGAARCVSTVTGAISLVPCADPARQTALDVFFATRPSLPATATSPFPVLRRSAWDAVLSSGATRLLDFGLTSTLSEIYRAQELATDNVERLSKGALTQTSMFEPTARAATVQLLWLTLADIASAESRLESLYRQELPALREAERK